MNGREAARSGEWAQHFSNASCFVNRSDGVREYVIEDRAHHHTINVDMLAKGLWVFFSVVIVQDTLNSILKIQGKETFYSKLTYPFAWSAYFCCFCSIF